MWRCALVFTVLTGSAAEAGQARSSFQVGLTITGPANTAAPVQARASSISVPLPRPRPREAMLSGSRTRAIAR